MIKLDLESVLGSNSGYVANRIHQVEFLGLLSPSFACCEVLFSLYRYLYWGFILCFLSWMVIKCDIYQKKECNLSLLEFVGLQLIISTKF